MLATVHAGDRVSLTGSTHLVAAEWDTYSDDGSVRLEIEATDVGVLA